MIYYIFMHLIVILSRNKYVTLKIQLLLSDLMDKYIYVNENITE